MPSPIIFTFHIFLALWDPALQTSMLQNEEGGSLIMLDGGFNGGILLLAGGGFLASVFNGRIHCYWFMIHGYTLPSRVTRAEHDIDFSSFAGFAKGGKAWRINTMGAFLGPHMSIISFPYNRRLRHCTSGY
jgi:hypothetical protein